MITENYKFPHFTAEMYDKILQWYETHNNGECHKKHKNMETHLIFKIVPVEYGEAVTVRCDECDEEITLQNPID